MFRRKFIRLGSGEVIRASKTVPLAAPILLMAHVLSTRLACQQETKETFERRAHV